MSDGRDRFEITEPGEDCPLVGMTPGLVESHPITAGRAAACDPTDGVCEACQ